MAEILAVKNGVTLPRDMDVAQAKNDCARCSRQRSGRAGVRDTARPCVKLPTPGSVEPPPSPGRRPASSDIGAGLPRPAALQVGHGVDIAANARIVDRDFLDRKLLQQLARAAIP